MSRFAQRPWFAALGLFGVIAVSGPALAETVQPRFVDPCPQWSASRNAMACRIGARASTRPRVRTAALDPRPVVRDDLLFAYAPNRYLSLLILGVGF